MASRSTSTTTTTTVRHIAKPSGRNRTSGPNLGDLREFVQRCEDLPDDLHVFITSGHVDEGGRCDVTIEVRHTHPANEPAGAG